MFWHKLKQIWHPAMYQGRRRMKGYFEGWYFKLVDASEEHRLALIPGVSFDRDENDQHCFVQYLDGSGPISQYFKYDIKEFQALDLISGLSIGRNTFSPEGIEMDLDLQHYRLRGSLNFQQINPWPVRFCSPGAMGWYAFVPAMECYHGVLSFDHVIEGKLEVNGRCIDFSGGRGYIEKDWGRSFPSYHIWLQCNHFDQPGTSLMISIANVPWLRSSFDGFLVGFLHNGKLYRFTTYTGAKITRLHYSDQQLAVHFRSSGWRLEVEVSYSKGAQLATPVVGKMRGRLSESLTSTTHLRLLRLHSTSVELVFEGEGRHTGLEIEGGLPALSRNLS
jgi:tocopherol cyclase